MSRDRLAERRRARENTNTLQEQRQAYSNSHPDPLRSNYDYHYGYQQDGYDPSAPAGYGAYDHDQPAASQYYSSNTMVYSDDAGQTSSASLHGAPPPSYKSRHDTDDEGRSRPSRSRRPSQSGRSERNGDERRPSNQRSRSGDDAQHPPMPSNAARSRGGTRQQSYGSREDSGDNYASNNQSSTALSTRQPHGNFDQHRPRRSRQDSSNAHANDMYEIPTLPKGTRQRKQSQTVEPRSPPYSATAPGSSGPSPGYPGNTSGMHVTSDAPEVDMNAFFEELDSVRDSMREMDEYITYIDQLHSRSMSGTAGEDVATELAQANDSMRKLTNDLRKRVKALQETTRIRTHGQAEQDRVVRKAQTEGLKTKFMELLQNYQTMEMKQRDRSRQRIERQYLIAKPNASPEEVRQAVEGGQDVQVFAQALRQSNRVGNAQNVLNEVQSRHEAIKQIEKTLVELFQMFQDMSQMVEEQDEQIIMIEEKAEEAAKDVEAGHTEIVQAVVSAKKSRKKRKCCCIISLILILILLGVLAYLIVKVILPKINENKEKETSEQAKETKTVTQSASTRTPQAGGNTNTNRDENARATAMAMSSTAERALRVRDLLALPTGLTGAGSPEGIVDAYALKG